MDRRSIVSVSVIAALCIALPGSAVSQQKSLKDQLIGAWTHVSTKYQFPDGKMTDTFGLNAKGVLIFDPSRHMAFINMRGGLPKFASDDPTKGTPEEK